VISNKPVHCKFCPPADRFEVVITTKIKAEDGEDDDISGGFASHTGWSALRDHVQKAHPAHSAKLSEWIYGTTEWKLPYEVVEKESKKAEAQCGKQTEVAA
jgi:hypothetical protein